MKRVRIEFHGGFKDGDVVVERWSSRTGSLVQMYFFLTDKGRIGQRFRAEPDSEDTLGATGPWQWLDAVLAIEDEDAMIRAIIEHANSEQEAQATQTPQMYEVTQCEEGPEEIQIRVDAVDDIQRD